MYKISNGDTTFDVTLNAAGNTGTLNGENFDVDAAQIDANSWHILHNNRGYNVQVTQADVATKTFTINVNGENYNLKAKDDFDILLDKMGLANLTQTKINQLKAPMPGLVIDILVAPGTEVAVGTPLIILEAMKMENVLKSPTAGIVKNIAVEKGQAVEKNYNLITFA